ncbi:MAG: acyltransferase [Cohaesibacter sp.]|nr:acyltransferase [Cohaesibacter sp.]
MQRISYIDGLRGISILVVILFHFYYRWHGFEPAYYPYDSLLSGHSLWDLGQYGVQLFFAISGFVIFLTLERSKNAADFAVKRFARLWPTLFLCSVLTFATLLLIPDLWSRKALDFLPSLTLIHPEILNKLVPWLEVSWIDGAYWSLFAELQFYILAALFYFYAPKRLPLYFGLFMLATISFGFVVAQFGTAYHLKAYGLLSLAKESCWFLIGIAAYLLANDRRSEALQSLTLAMIGVMATSILFEDLVRIPVALVCAGLLILPMHMPLLQKMLSIKPLSLVGMASYSLYLLHQHAGLSINHALSARLGLGSEAALGLSFIVIGLLVGLSLMIYHRWEQPANRWIVKAYYARHTKKDELHMAAAE